MKDLRKKYFSGDLDTSLRFLKEQKGRSVKSTVLSRKKSSLSSSFNHLILEGSPYCLLVEKSIVKKKKNLTVIWETLFTVRQVLT